jgi:alpha-tubulin suppressor-like RCC1 family protein
VTNCAIVGNGVKCWGTILTQRFEPKSIGSVSDPIEITGAGCVLEEAGAVKCLDKTGTLQNIALPGAGVALAGLGVHTCAVTKKGEVACWRATSPEVEKIEGVSDAIDVAVGQRHACALSKVGTVSCWGKNDKGQLAPDGGLLGLSGGKDSSSAVKIEGVTGVVELDAGSSHTCARHDNGTVTCWGDNSHLQSGLEKGSSAKPTKIAGLEKVDRLAMGLDDSCARTDGKLVCWGSDEHRLLINGNQDSHQPIPLRGLPEGITELDLGFKHGCARVGDGDDLQCWGEDELGQLGAKAPGFVELEIPDVRTISVGALMVCAITGDDGKLECPGMERWEKDHADLSAERGYQEVAAGVKTVCATREDGTSHCWDSEGESWDPSPRKNLKHINAGGHAICAMSFKGETLCLGREGRTMRNMRFHEIVPITYIMAASSHRCVIEKRTKAVMCHGNNDSGQLGVGEAPSKGVKDPKLPRIVALDASSAYTCALTKKKDVRCWGSRRHEDIPKPKNVGVSGIQEIAVGDDFACALAETGEVQCWGENDEGQLGDGSTQGRETPAKVELPAKALQISAHSDSACARLENGHTVCWGRSPLTAEPRGGLEPKPVAI